MSPRMEHMSTRISIVCTTVRTYVQCCSTEHYCMATSLRLENRLWPRLVDGQQFGTVEAAVSALQGSKLAQSPRAAPLAPAPPVSAPLMQLRVFAKVFAKA